MTPLDDIVRECGIDPTQITLPDYQRTPGRPTYLTSVLRLSAYEIWDKLRELLPPVGYWPVLGWDIFVRPPGDWDFPTPDDTIAEGLSFDLESWLKEEGTVLSSSPYCQHAPKSRSSEPRFGYNIVWTDLNAKKNASLDRSQIPLTLFPVDVTWKVPAYLWIIGQVWITTQVPRGAHIAIQKRWFERWGAEIVAAAGASVDLRVLRPPTTLAEACIVAGEMLAYDSDFDYENTLEESVAALAQRVLNSKVWELSWG